MTWSDHRDPDPSEIVDQIEAFLHRIRVLFTEGLIMGEAMTNTFTAQIIDFYRQSKVLQVGKENR